MSAAPSSRWSRATLLVVAIVAFAAAARLTHLAWDQNHFFHPDERATAGAVMRLSLRPLQLNPQFFAYGSLPMYLARLTTGAVALIDPRATGYDGTILYGRAMSGVIGTLTVLVLIILGSRLYDRSVGLLAGLLLAACALHIQNSRFLTVDVTLTFFVLLALSQMVRASIDGRASHFVTSGIALGLATASKFSAMPLFLPLGIAALHRYLVERQLASVAGRLLLGVLAAAAAFALAQPYAILDFHAFIHDIFEQSTMVRNAGVFPYTVQYMGTVKYWYDIEQLVVWGMAPALGLVAVWASVTRVGVAWRTRRAEEWILLSWVVPFFLITGWFEVKFPRYLLPIYPIMILWAAETLVRWYRSGRLLGRLATPVVVAGTLAAAFAFMAIYTRPHTVVTASEWVYRHIPPESKILSQHWDEGFPFSLPGHSASIYKVNEFGYYEPDTPAKVQSLARELAQSDYIAFQTKRLYGAVTRAPQRFPLTTNYFYELFAGDLGYTLVHEVASRPSLFGIEVPDELGDESLTVYDHPKVLIFQNTGHLDAAVIADKILHGLPSRALTRDDLLLAHPSGEAPMETAGAAPPIRSSVLALILFVLLVEGLSLAVYPLVRRWLPWPGTLAFSKTFGVLLFSYVSWLSISVGAATFTQGRLLGFAVALAFLGTLLWRRGAHRPQSGSEIVATEALFWGAFLFFVVVRAFNPEVFWGEKPMDFSFLNSLMRATTLPPPEPWFAGSPLQYNYFGHYTVAALGKTLHLDPAITFNLGIALVGGLTAAAAFAAGAAITFRWGSGLLAAFFVTLIGNLASLREATSGLHRTYNFDYFWATSRVIKDTINEFPLWSFLFADLHAHVLVIPISLSFIALAVLWVRTRVVTPRQPAPAGATSVQLALLCLFLGAIMVTNTWSTPTYVLFVPFLIGTLWLTEGDYGSAFGFLGGVIVRVLLLTAFIVAGAYLLYLPFWSHFVPPERNFGWERALVKDLAQPRDFLMIFGLYLFVLVPFLYAVWVRNMRRDDEPLGVARGLVLILAVAVVLGSLAVSTRVFCAILFLLGLQLLLAPQTDSRWRIPLAMATFAFAVTAGCDLVYVWDRMNTIFKFYLEAWSLLALAAAVAAGALWSGALPLPGFPRAARRVWQLGLVGLIGVGLFTASTDVWGVIHTNRVQTPRPSLDGMAYLRHRAPDELAAYEWLNSHIKGIPVMLEATGDSYQDFTRVAMNTGLPTVLGWGYHVFQRGHNWAEINKRKADIETAYTSSDEKTVADILQRYHVALVFVGALERRVYAGGNLARFNEWHDLLTPIYQNPGVTVFAVNGRFAGTMPVTTIEDIPKLAAEEAPEQKGEEERSTQFPPGRVHQPRGVAVRDDGDIFVADFGNNRVQELHKDLTPGIAWGTRGEGPGQFKDPCGIAVGPTGEVLVADTWNQRVQVFDKDGKYQREWAGAFFGPRGVATDAKGTVFVADTGNARIVRFSPQGRLEIQWGGKGAAPGQFFEPTGLTVDGDKVYVCDNGNGRLQIFTRDGQFVNEFPVSGWESKVYSEPNVAVDPSGTIWVTVPGAKEIRAYDSKGKLLKTITGKSIPGVSFDTPMGIAYSAAEKQLIVTDLENRVLRVPLMEK
jgi:YYY domain-containing protein